MVKYKYRIWIFVLASGNYFPGLPLTVVVGKRSAEKMQRIAIIDVGSNSARLVISHILKTGPTI
jgi:hypothetical protein